MFPRELLQQGQGLLVVIAQGLGGDELCDGISRPQLRADLAEGDVIRATADLSEGIETGTVDTDSQIMVALNGMDGGRGGQAPGGDAPTGEMPSGEMPSGGGNGGAAGGQGGPGGGM